VSGMRAGYRRREALENRILLGISAAIIALMLAPIFVVVAMSFSSSAALSFPPAALSLRWYHDALELVFAGADSLGRLRESFFTSIEIALIAATTSALCGVPAAYALSRLEFRGKWLVEQLVSLPIVFPTVVLGVAILLLLSEAGVDLGIFQIAFAHTITLLPFMIRNCNAALAGLDPALEEAAHCLGAPPLRTFAEIVLPLMRAGIASGFLLVFIMSFNEFTLAYFLYTIDVFPLSMWLFQQGNNELNPAIFAVATMIIAFNAIIIIVVDRIMGAKGVAL
jgi:putative spermidine/putrescine transport system permease protein